MREECLVEKRNVEIHQWEVARAARQREEKEEKERQYRTSHFLPSDNLLSGVNTVLNFVFVFLFLEHGFPLFYSYSHHEGRCSTH